MVLKLWYAYQQWCAKAFNVVHEKTYFLFFFTKKYIHTYIFYLSVSVNKFLCSLLPLLVSKNGRNTFSQPFSSCCICVNSGFPNFWSNYVWHRHPGHWTLRSGNACCLTHSILFAPCSALPRMRHRMSDYSITSGDRLLGFLYRLGWVLQVTCLWDGAHDLLSTNHGSGGRGRVGACHAWLRSCSPFY